MNQIYFTADLHFGHSNILKHSPKRPFSDTVNIKAHDEWLLDLYASYEDHTWAVKALASAITSFTDAFWVHVKNTDMRVIFSVS